MTEPDPIEPEQSAAEQSDDLPRPDEQGTAAFRVPVAPIVAERLRPTVVGTAAVAALLVALAAVAGYAVTLGLTLALALVLAATWPAVSGSMTPTATSLVLAVSSVLVVGAALREDLLWIAAAVAFGVVLSFFHQLLRAPGREGLVITLLAAFGGLALVASTTTMAALAHRDTTQGFVVVAMAAVLAALLADLVVGSSALRPFLSVVAFVAAVVAALGAAVWFERVGALDAAGLGAAVGTLSWSFRRVLSGQAAMLGAKGQVAAGLGSVFVTGGVVHLYGVIA